VELREKSRGDITAAVEKLGSYPLSAEQVSETYLPKHEHVSLWKWLRGYDDDVKLLDRHHDALAQVLNSKNHLERACAVRQLRWMGANESIDPNIADPFVKQSPKSGGLLRKSCNDPSGLVRLEAAIAASYIGTPEALEAALDLLKHPMDPYLTYALRTSLDSHTLQPLWKGNTAFLAKHPELEKFLKDSEPTKPALMAKKRKPEPPNPFDNQPGLQTITIKTIPERLLYDLREFKVAPGAPVKLVFENPDVTPHNLLIVQPGAADEVGLAGNEMAKTPDGFAKGFIPDSPKILHKTKMLNQGDRESPPLHRAHRQRQIPLHLHLPRPLARHERRDGGGVK
jgi:hypothetical protein